MLTMRTWIPIIALLFGLIANGCSNRSHDRTTTEAQTQTPAEIPTETPTETPAPAPAGTFTVTAYAGAGGRITPASISVNQGESAIFTVTPDPGFSLVSVVPSGCAGALIENTYTTGPITSDCAVAATFAANTVPVAETFVVTTFAGAGGSITPTSVSVYPGASVILSVAPAAGYSIASVTPSGCTGTWVGNTYTTGPITAPCAVTASFRADTVIVSFNVTTSAGAGGSITPARISVAQGASAVLVLTPNTGFSIASVAASGCSGTLSGATYTTGPITADCAVAANFSANSIPESFTVSASAGTGGNISPTSVSVTQGASTTLTVTPNIGFSIAGVTPTGCTGTLVGNVFTTGPITTHCAVAASFTANSYTVTANAGTGGSISPASVSVTHGANAILTVTPDTGLSIASVSASGCSGSLSGAAFTAGPITAHCTITANFAVTTTTSVASKIAAGGSHTCALTSAGAVQCWGDNFYGELGDGSTARSIIPVTVTGLSGSVTALSTGAQHTCALSSMGVVQCWGYNRYGQVGNGSTTDSATPVTVTGLSGPVTALAAGSYHTCALTSTGTVQCWGYNANGQLGNSSTTNSTTPVTVASLSGMAAILVAGTQHNCVLTSLGSLQCWGYNANGQLGNGATANATAPVTVAGLSGTATTLAAGSNHTCALTSTGVMQCWGYNASGQLGNGGTTNAAAPITVIGLNSPVTALAAGNTHTCALTSTGTVLCWGGNAYGQLGIGSTTNSSIPVSVTGLSGPVTALAVGYGHNCVLTSVGAAQCWGYNLYGQLGNGSTTNSPGPVSVTGLSGLATALAEGFNRVWNRIWFG